MLLRVKLVGEGSRENPFRVGLPTYEVLDANYDGKFAIVRVPDEDVPNEILNHPSTGWVSTPYGLAARIPQGHLHRWQAHLKTRYPSSPDIESLNVFE